MPGDSVWNGNVATIRLNTSDAAVYDIVSIYKVYNGDDGAPAYTVFLTNENASFPANSEGEVDDKTVATSVIVYKG